jgi:hypothetical protein
MLGSPRPLAIAGVLALSWWMTKERRLGHSAAMACNAWDKLRVSQHACAARLWPYLIGYSITTAKAKQSDVLSEAPAKLDHMVVS